MKGEKKFYTLKEWEEMKKDKDKSKFTPLIKTNPSVKDRWIYSRLNPGFRIKWN